MNRYELVDFETNTIYSIEKVEIEFEENETMTSSVSCIDEMDLFKEIIETTIGHVNARQTNAERYQFAMYLLKQAFDNLDDQIFTNYLDFNEVLNNDKYPFDQSLDEITHNVKKWYYDNDDIVERTPTNEK